LTATDSPSFARISVLCRLAYSPIFPKRSTTSPGYPKTSLISHYLCPIPTLCLTENLVPLNMLTESLINTKNALIYPVYMTKTVCSPRICFSTRDCKCYGFRRKLSSYLSVGLFVQYLLFSGY